MKIFNEELEKHLLYNEIEEVLYKVPFLFVFYSLSLFMIVVFGGIIFNVVMELTNYSLSSCSQVVVLLFEGIVLVSIAYKLVNIIEKIILKPSISPSNPTLAKLKNAAKQKDCVNLVKLWKCFNPDHSSNSITLGQNQKDIELLQKLDNDLVRFIENADDVTIKLFSLEDFESYKQLYIKYIAPKEKESLLKQIQRLISSLSNTNNSQENHIIQQLNELKNEIEKYDIDTKDYFEFKKWNDDTWEMLKLDKNNDMVKKQYQKIMQKING